MEARRSAGERRPPTPPSRRGQGAALPRSWSAPPNLRPTRPAYGAPAGCAPWPRAMRCPRAFMDRGACRLPGAKIADAKKSAGRTPLALEANESAGRTPEAAPRDGGDSRARPSALRMWRKRRIRQKGGATGARPPCGKPGQPQAGGEGGQQDAGGWGERPRAPGLAKGATSRHGAGFVASCSRIRRRTGPGGGAPARAAVTTIKAQARGRRRSGTRTGGPERAAAPAILRSLPQEAPARPAPPRARRRIRTNVQGVRRVPASGRMRIRAPARRNSMSLT